LELANFSTIADGKGGYTIDLNGSLELRDSANHVVWRTDPKDRPSRLSSPPQDFYRVFRMSVPAVPAGIYGLTVKTVDRATGREVRQTIEFRIGAK
jgi:hypothetical protein